MFEKIVNGKSSFLYDFIAISRSSDMLKRVYFYLRELKRFESERPIPPLYYLDYELIIKNAMSQKGNEAITKNFIKQVEAWTCTKITEEKLKEACQICNENRSALAAFSALRYGPDCKVTGTEALTAISATLFMEKEKSTALIKELTEDAKSWPAAQATRVFYTGSAQESTEVYELIEELGGNVVSEDHDWGDRHFNKNVDLSLDAFKGITARYMFRLPSSERSFVSERCKALLECVKNTGAQAVLVYMNFNDESYLMDYPSQKVELDKLGIPSLDITLQQVPIKDRDAVKAKLQKLIDAAKA